MKHSRFLTLVVVMVMALTAVIGTSTSSAQDEPLRIKLVINGVLGDKSFFDSAQRGMDRLIEDGYNVEVNTIELGTANSGWETGLSDAMVGDDYDILIVGTWQMPDFLMARVHLYPDKKFIIFDTTVAYDDPTKCIDGCKNVYSVMYKQNEGSFLAGVYGEAMSISGLEGMNPEGIIGAIGGGDIPVINDFVVGYEQGACLVNPDSQVLVQYVGGDAGWNDPAKGKEIALAMFEQKADIVFNIAGGSGLGMFEAAQEQSHYAIGVDSDQAAEYPDLAPQILTSMMKRVDNSLYRAIDLDIKGELTYGAAETLGVAEEGIGLIYDDAYYTRTPENVLDLMDAVEEAMTNGEFTINTNIGDAAVAVGQGCDLMPETEFDASEYLQ
jgi:basic membrane protein A and related proteins